jgi:hypothetical protein
MMKYTRLASVILTAAIATVLLAAPGTASASPPEFSPGTLNIFTGEGSPGTLETSSGTIVTCLRSLSAGEITGPRTVAKNGTESCSLKSEGGPNASLIIIHKMDGELGSVKPTEAESGVGLLILPTAGTLFVALEGSCLPLSPTPVDGSIVAEVIPVNGASSKDGKRIFLGSPKGIQKIKEINVLGRTVKPALRALGLLESNAIEVELVLLTNPVIVT